MNTELSDGHINKGRKLIPNLQFCRKLAHEVMDNTIRVDTVDYGKPRRSTFTPDLVPCKLQKIKNHEGSYGKKAKRSKMSSRNIKNSDEPPLKLATNGLEVFVNTPWASLFAMDVSLNIKLKLLLMHN